MDGITQKPKARRAPAAKVKKTRPKAAAGKEFKSLLEQLGPLSDDGKVMRIACPSRFIREYVAEHHLTSMSAILEGFEERKHTQ